MKPSDIIMNKVVKYELKQNWWESLWSNRMELGLVAILEYLDEQHEKESK